MKKPKRKRQIDGWMITVYVLLCTLIISISMGLMCSFLNSFLTPVTGKPQTEQAK